MRHLIRLSTRANEYIDMFSRVNPIIRLSLDELIRLNDMIKTRWAAFVKNAPKSWKKDKWISSRKPVGIVAQFGQNQPMAMNDHIQYERTSWRESRDYSKARWLSYAAATHFEYVTQLFNPPHKSISFIHPLFNVQIQEGRPLAQTRRR
jgi:hypothetical protein